MSLAVALTGFKKVLGIRSDEIPKRGDDALFVTRILEGDWRQRQVFIFLSLCTPLVLLFSSSSRLSASCCY